MARSKSRRKATKSKPHNTATYPQKTAHAAIEFIKHPDGSQSIVSYPAGAKLIDPNALYLAKALDSEWFRLHPYRTHRVRRAIEGEETNVTPNTYVIIRQLRPGLRERISFEALVSLPEGDAPEHVAHALYDVFKNSAGRVIRSDEWAARIHAYESGGAAEDGSEKPPTVH
jgi:hypothetical protein